MRLNYDGTNPIAADSANVDATPATYTTLDTGVHTPGLDDSLHNRVVRTYDQYGYVIDYDINEAAGKNVMLTVTLTDGSGTTLADPTGTNPNPNSNVSWMQDAQMADRGWFTGCLPNPSNDPAGTRIVGATLYCFLGDLAEGTHGTIRPTVQLLNGLDTTAIGAKVTLTSTSSTQAITPSSVPQTVFVSATPMGNWIKNEPIVVPAKAGGTSTGADGYIALFPLGLTDQSQLGLPARGSTRFPAPSGQIDFYDHFYNIGGLTDPTMTNVRLATDAEMAYTRTSNPAGQRLYGNWCGRYDSQNAGALPGDIAATWTCSYSITAPNGYPVKGMGVNSYPTTAPALNADGSTNTKAYIVTGQLAFWISKAAIEAQNGINTAKFNNAISNVGSADNFRTTTTTIKPIEVIPVGQSPYGGTPELDLTPGDALTSRADNRSAFGITPGPGGGTGGTGAVSYTSHFGTISSSANGQLRVSVNSLGQQWDPSTPTVYPETWGNVLPSQTAMWDGKGTVARGQSVNMQMYVGAYSSVDKSSPIHGCMVWDSEQLQVTQMPDYTWRSVEDNLQTTTAFGTRTPNFPMADLSVGPSNHGSVATGAYRPTGIVAMTPAQMANFGVKLQFAYDSAVMRNTQTPPTIPNPASNYDNKTITGNVARNSVECNGNAAAGTRTAWVDATSPTLTYDSVAQAYKINGNAVNMARVVITGANPWHWNDTTGFPRLYGFGDLPAGTGLYLSLQAHVGIDLLKNYEGKSIYIHTSRASGAWNSSTGRPGPSTAADCNNIPLSVFPNRDWYDSTHLTGLSPTTTGWCNLPYDATQPGETGTTGYTLDGQNHTFSDQRIDSDTDRVKIVTVRPNLVKTNVDGLFDIADNGDLVTYKLDVSAIGSNQEALRNVTLADPMIANYELVSFTQPTTPGSYCDRRTISGISNLYCRFSSSTHTGPGTDTQPTGLIAGDPAPVGGTLPLGLAGATWSDSVTVTVRVTKAVASSTSNRALTNTATISSVGFGQWDPVTNAYKTGATINTTAEQTKVSSANSFLPFAADQGAILKAVDNSFGDCVADADGNVLSGEALTAWQARCALIGLDPTASGAVTDAEGNGTFTLSYTNQGNTNLPGLRIVDVLPYVGDGTSGPTEPSSGTGSVVTPGQQTVGDKRSPASAFAGRLGLLSVTLPAKPANTASLTYSGGSYWVTSAAPGTISRDPDVSYNSTAGLQTGEVTWCTAVGGTPVTGSTGTCPTTPWQVTAVYIDVLGTQTTVPGGVTTRVPLAPDATATVPLRVDTDGMQCGNIMTNTFGARVDPILLPIRSNDVSLMVPCQLQVQKVGEPNTGGTPVPMAGSEWTLYGSETGTTPLAYQFTTVGTGLFRAINLLPGTYWLEETKALDGFQLLAERVEVTISTNGTITLPPGGPSNVTVVTVNGTTTVQVEDIPTFDLPDAGGTGTVPIYLAGMLLVGAAVVIAALRLRRPIGPRRRRVPAL